MSAPDTSAGSPPPLRLALFFTRGAGLATWRHGGMLDRELALYRELARGGMQVIFVTYDRGPVQLDGFRVLSNRWRLPEWLYVLCLPRLHRRALVQCDVFKSNQTNGAEVARRCARILRKPFVSRCGYLWSEFAARQAGPGSAEHRRALEVERTVFGDAARVVVTTDAMAAAVRQAVPAAASRLVVMPNYVDTDHFAPGAAPGPGDRAVFVGRLAEQKNLPLLLEAIRGRRLHLTVIGDGPQRALVTEFAATHPQQLSWQARVPASDLPGVLREAGIFILPSRYEGHPKALLEAMACGLAIVATDAPGIREVVEHERTGLLCAPDPASLGAALDRLVADAGLRERLGAAARSEAMARYALSGLARREADLLRAVAGRA